MATHTPDGIKENINPPLLGRPEELPDALSCKKPIKCGSIDIVIVEIFILHMKNHFIPPESDSSETPAHPNNFFRVVPIQCNRVFVFKLLYFGTIQHIVGEVACHGRAG
jgi:hypothetical protein